MTVFGYLILLYKHQCFIRISATEKIHIFSHEKYDNFTCENIVVVTSFKIAIAIAT